ncbi:MAG: hypothetical protein J5507_01485 [Clostridia bacterium]|nr:hypothetical protein [Clostridia bacterium]
MTKIKTEKGVTLVSLIMTIIILSILSTITITTIKSSNNVAPYNKMIADISLLEDKILIYYNKNGEIPKKENTYIPIPEETTYYEIDLNKLENVTLNFGTDESDEDDRYFVNNNLKVYYKKGIKKLGETYHTK